VQDPVLVRGHRGQTLGSDRGDDASPQRFQSVFAKVVAVALADALEKKPDLDLFDPGFNRLDSN
jgi:hypothetical protein